MPASLGPRRAQRGTLDVHEAMLLHRATRLDGRFGAGQAEPGTRFGHHRCGLFATVPQGVDKPPAHLGVIAARRQGAIRAEGVEVCDGVTPGNHPPIDLCHASLSRSTRALSTADRSYAVPTATMASGETRPGRPCRRASRNPRGRPWNRTPCPSRPRRPPEGGAARAGRGRSMETADRAIKPSPGLPTESKEPSQIQTPSPACKRPQ